MREKHKQAQFIILTALFVLIILIFTISILYSNTTSQGEPIPLISYVGAAELSTNYALAVGAANYSLSLLTSRFQPGLNASISRLICPLLVVIPASSIQPSSIPQLVSNACYSASLNALNAVERQIRFELIGLSAYRPSIELSFVGFNNSWLTNPANTTAYGIALITLRTAGVFDLSYNATQTLQLNIMRCRPLLTSVPSIFYFIVKVTSQGGLPESGLTYKNFWTNGTSGWVNANNAVYLGNGFYNLTFETQPTNILSFNILVEDMRGVYTLGSYPTLLCPQL
jgi:hypothetical protein